MVDTISKVTLAGRWQTCNGRFFLLNDNGSAIIGQHNEKDNQDYVLDNYSIWEFKLINILIRNGDKLVKKLVQGIEIEDSEGFCYKLEIKEDSGKVLLFNHIGKKSFYRQ